jgi:transglutaminase-like putative cysteine protease
LFLAGVAAAAEEWYIVSIAGQPVGSIQEMTTETPDGIRIESRLQLVLNRLGTRVEMASTSSTVESKEGRLRTAGIDLKMSSLVTSTVAEVGEGVVKIRSQAGGQSFDRTAEFSGELLGPEGIRRATAARLAKPGDSFQAQTFSPELAAVVTVRRTLVGSETIASQGRDVPALKAEEQISGLPGKRTLWLDAGGRLLASEETGPFGPMRVFRADAATAQRVGEEGGELPAEAYSATLVRTQIRLPEPRRIDWLKLRLLHRNPDLGWPAGLERPGQRVVEKTDRELVLEVSRQQPVYGLTFPVPATDANREYLEPNAYLQSNEPEIRAQALEIVGEEKDLFRAALELERWVAEAMRFDLGIAMAPSVEIFKNRRGTCVGYATLLTTLARAAGIPARLVMGYVYVDGMFGGHAWTEVLAEDQWLPLDAAVVAPGTADSARFAFVSTSLREGPGMLNAGPALQLFGQIGVRVLGYAREGGERMAVAEDAQPYSVAGDVYRNLGLGIELRKPAGFRFVDLDKVWPESILVGLAGANGDKVSLQSRRRYPWEEAEAAAWSRLETEVPSGRRGEMNVAGRAAYLIEGNGRAAVAIPGSETVWILTAEGAGAADLVRQVAAGLRM